ncbi:MobV family relaxase, partial [Uliginosibacterium flavum]
FRERETVNADETKTPENEHLAARSTDEAMGKLRELLPESRRKDAVLAVEYVCTASPEWWKTATPGQQADFFKRSVEWIEDKYGKENLIVATIHRDEKSPHLSAYVVPKTQDGRLSAKEFIGNRAQMVADQTSFAQRVADLGLERGIEGSKAKHQTIKDFYAQVEQPVREVRITPEAASPRLLEKSFLSSRHETPEMVAERLTRAVSAAYAPVVAKAKVADSEARRAAEMAFTAQEKQRQVVEARQTAAKLLNDGKELIRILAQGGPAAEKILQTARERLAAEEKQKTRAQDSGRSR